MDFTKDHKNKVNSLLMEKWGYKKKEVLKEDGPAPAREAETVKRWRKEKADKDPAKSAEEAGESDVTTATTTTTIAEEGEFPDVELAPDKSTPGGKEQPYAHTPGQSHSKQKIGDPKTATKTPKIDQMVGGKANPSNVKQVAKLEEDYEEEDKEAAPAVAGYAPSVAPSAALEEMQGHPGKCCDMAHPDEEHEDYMDRITIRLAEEEELKQMIQEELAGVLQMLEGGDDDTPICLDPPCDESPADDSGDPHPELDDVEKIKQAQEDEKGVDIKAWRDSVITSFGDGTAIMKPSGKSLPGWPALK